MTESRSKEDVADEVLDSEDVDDESKEYRMDTNDEGETRYIYVEVIP